MINVPEATGWQIFRTFGERLQVQRVDEIQAYPSDKEAIAAAKRWGVLCTDDGIVNSAWHASNYEEQTLDERWRATIDYLFYLLPEKEEAQFRVWERERYNV